MFLVPVGRDILRREGIPSLVTFIVLGHTAF